MSAVGAGPRPAYTDKVFIGIHTSQPYGIFTSSTSQFQNYRIIVLKKVTVPIPLHIERNVIGHRISFVNGFKLALGLCVEVI